MTSSRVGPPAPASLRHASRLAAVAAVLAAFAVALLSGCSPGPAVRDAVLVTIDTLRADRLGCSGNPVVRTPHLDRFFRGGAQFAEAYTPAPTTLASHASMLTGLWPSGHGVPRNGWPLAPEIPLVQELFASKKFACGAFVSSAALDPSFGLGRGFEVYDFEPSRTVRRDQGWRPAAETIDRALSLWRAERARRRFLFLHVFEPHFPYEPDARDFAVYDPLRSATPDSGLRPVPDGSMDRLFSIWEHAVPFTPELRAELLALYHAEITALDRVLGPALDELSASNALVVVTSDHGESLGEHHYAFKHGQHVYAGDVHVPLGVRGAAPFEAVLAGAFVRTIDLAPTMLAALKVRAALPGSEGVDLAASAAGILSNTDLPVFAEASMPWNAELPGQYPNRFKQRAVRTRGEALVVTPWSGAAEWFDRANDPGELDPVPPPDSPAFGKLERDLDAWGARGAPRDPPTAIDPALVEQLHGLGYVDR